MRKHNVDWKKRHPFFSELSSFLFLFMKCYAVVWLLTSFVLKPIRVEGSSMYPTYENGNIGISNIIDKEIHGIERFDIAIVKSPLNEQERWIKRIIALPNERIVYHNDVLYINDKEIEESFLDPTYMEAVKAEFHVDRFTEDFGPIILGDDEYFVMGDNRRHSDDSRVVGSFKKDCIVSKDAYILIK